MALNSHIEAAFPKGIRASKLSSSAVTSALGSLSRLTYARSATANIVEGWSSGSGSKERISGWALSVERLMLSPSIWSKAYGGMG